ncbi:hypothetical protein [Lentzea cavernae]|uniref:Uncharacterized protein n=1 Tax=Lentzea cavernae TaxID=2020703 RepID=A0ABQ3MV03_9PSEU|nr:hypothetical protein [Lentzea cavernae]GHH58438.1 hypothetical protein GCM10017774_79860 [Lentzea cavernae]
MSNEFKGRVTGNSFQIGKVHTLNMGGDAATKSGAEPPPDKPSAVQFAVGFALVVVIIAIGAACQGDDKPVFPAADQGTRPAGVSDDAVAEVVADKLAQCATEVVLEPVNCPQAHSATSPRNVRWELVGEPRDGMQVRWVDDKFLARGTAVMTVGYEAATGKAVEVKGFHFETEVPWRGDQTRIESIRQPKPAPAAGTIRKERYDLPDGDLTKAVRDGFAACAATVPMPPKCPHNPHTPSGKDMTREVEGDPVANWTSTKDAEFGLIRVKASYSLVARWTETFFTTYETSRTQSGTYEATIIRTPNKTAQLLTVKHVS